jgi:hypothetical protein
MNNSPLNFNVLFYYIMRRDDAENAAVVVLLVSYVMYPNNETWNGRMYHGFASMRLAGVLFWTGTEPFQVQS